MQSNRIFHILITAEVLSENTVKIDILNQIPEEAAQEREKI